MDRELLLEIGCEELPAGWLPVLTVQVGDIVGAELRAHRLAAESPVETYSTPRRLTVRVSRIPERQTDPGQTRLILGASENLGAAPAHRGRSTGDRHFAGGWTDRWRRLMGQLAGLAQPAA